VSEPGLSLTRGVGVDYPSLGALADELELDTFWRARPVLAHLHAFARARRVAPWALLGVTLARVVAVVPPVVVLPSLVGSYGSLNLFVGVVGRSGAGKGTAESAAVDAVPLPGPVATATIGSGEGSRTRTCGVRKTAWSSTLRRCCSASRRSTP